LRLQLLCLLDPGEWRRFSFLCDVVGIPQDRLKRHFFVLRSHGYVETRRGRGQEGWARLTEHGDLEREAYLTALVTMLPTARAQVKTARGEQPDWFEAVTDR
jgi:DNA-binding transcriptional ArsR family regulator